MGAGHVVVEARPALVLARALGALEVWGLAHAARVVVLHAPNTPALELAALERDGIDLKVW